MSPLNLVACFVLFINYFAYANVEIKCKDDDGNSVDWFIAYNMPKIKTPPNQKPGTYMYLTSATPAASEWIISDKKLGDPATMMAKTLSPVYDNNVADTIVVVLYNDQIPGDNTASKTNGIAKGVVVANENTGFWMIHSVPSFPATPSTRYVMPDVGIQHGHTFLCISINSDQVETIASQLDHIEVNSYAPLWTEALSLKYPKLIKVANKIFDAHSKCNKEATIRSTEGLEFFSFVKTKEWAIDMYSRYIAPKLKQRLIVNSLQIDGMPDYCIDYKVYNVDYKGKALTDHSKWAISQHHNGKDYWFCIGDIDRDFTHTQKGGGTVCVVMKQLWERFEPLAIHEECSSLAQLYDPYEFLNVLTTCEPEL